MSYWENTTDDIHQLQKQKNKLLLQLNEINKQINIKEGEIRQALYQKSSQVASGKSMQQNADYIHYSVPQSVKQTVLRRHFQMAPTRYSSSTRNGKLYWSPVYEGSSDMFNEFYDNDGNYICAPSGGITGKGDGKCPPNW